MILITGGTGQSGREIVKQLAATGAQFKMLVRDPAKAATVAPAGIELVKGDLNDMASIAAAAAGCDVALFVADGNPKLAEQQRTFDDGVRRAGVNRVVRFSVMGADPASPLDFAKWHGQAEAELKSSGLTWTLLRPTFFMQNILGSAATIKSAGAIYMPADDGKAPYVDLADIAAVAVATLTQPGKHDGQAYTITGPADVSWADIAAAVSAATGKPVTYVNVPEAAARTPMLAAGLEPWRVDAILGLMLGTRNGWLTGVSGDVQRVTGRPAKSVDQWAKENAAAFM